MGVAGGKGGWLLALAVEGRFSGEKWTPAVLLCHQIETSEGDLKTSYADL